MQLTQRQAVIALFLIQVSAGTISLSYFALIVPQSSVLRGLIVGVPTVILLFIAYLRGWEKVRYVNLMLITALVVGPFITPAMDRSFSPVSFLPVALAVVMARPRWVLIIAVAIMSILLLRAEGVGPYVRVDNLVVYFACVGSIYVGTLIADQTRQRLELQHETLQAAHMRAEQQAQENAQQAAILAEQTARQQHLIDTIQLLEIPITAIADGVLLASFVGAFDEQRVQAANSRILSAVYSQKARLMILDIAGITLLDRELTEGLLKVAQSIRLLGCRVALSGISATISQELINARLSFDGVHTTRTVQDALHLLPQQEIQPHYKAISRTR
jgi:anti-anti-sigma regulatory factor